MLKLLLLTTLVGLLATSSPSPSGAVASGDFLKNYDRNQALLKDKIEALDETEDFLETEIYRIDSHLEIRANRLNELQKEIETERDRVEKVNDYLATAQGSIDRRQRMLGEIIRLKHELDALSLLDLLLSSNGVGEFITRAHFLYMILNKDLELITEQQEQIETLEGYVEHKESSIVLLEDLEKNFTLAKNEYETLKKARQVYLERVRAERKMTVSILAEQQKQMESYLASLAREKNGLVQSYLTEGNYRLNPDVILPLTSFRKTSDFGTRTDPFTKKTSTHSGLDLAAPEGTPILAVDDGVILSSGYRGGYGNCITIFHPKGYITLYGHIKEGGLLVKEGDRVSQGDKIALVGSTGRSTGPHLHFEYHVDGKRRDPVELLTLPN